MDGIMRRYSKYLWIILLLPVWGCEKWIDLIPPDGLIREEFWNKKEDVESVLMGAYESMAAMDELFFKYGEIRADMVTGDYAQSIEELKVQESNIYPDNPLCSWAKFYQVINYCNEVIANAPEVQEMDDTFNDYLLQGYMAEAHFLRSLSYFYLVRVFRDVPLILEPSDNDEVDFYVPKTDGDEVLRKIRADLVAYRNFAPADALPTLEMNKGRASLAAFDALLADIALWNFEYEECLTHIVKIENSDQYRLLKRVQWFELFYPGNSIEGIFEFQFEQSRGQNNNMYGLTQVNSHRYDPSERALELFDPQYTVDLYRGEGVSIKKYGEGDYIIWKYVGMLPDGTTVRSGSEQTSCNWIVYRYAEILLMKAEALSQLGRYAEAQETLNEVRERADVPLLSLPDSPSAFEDAILDERARELAFEGKRWFDLLRMGRRNNYARKDKLIELVIRNVPSTQKRILALKLNNPLGWYFPIHENELERNRALKQNPYYQF
jgi:starch-binding outer membrane protein, SusD/RagB family